MGFTVLVVCTANICRSPVGAEVVRRAVARSPLPDEVTVVSRGLAALEGEAVCPVALSLADLGGISHSSSLLTLDDVAGADLILTADLDQRAAIVRMQPAARRRTFTMLEAAALAQWLADGSPLPEGVELAAGPPRPDDVAARLSWWVPELNEARGLPSLGRENRFDIPDAHGPDSVSHVETTATVIASCDAVGSALHDLLS